MLYLKDSNLNSFKAKVIAVEKEGLVIRIIDNQTEINGKLLDTTSNPGGIKAGAIINFDEHGVGTLLTPAKPEKKEKTSVARNTGSNKPVKINL